MRYLISAALLAIALTGCGSGGDKGSDAPGGTPDCSELWQVGQTLPEGYVGCTTGDAEVPADLDTCSDGRSFAVFGASGLIGIEGEEITLDTDQVMAECFDVDAPEAEEGAEGGGVEGMPTPELADLAVGDSATYTTYDGIDVDVTLVSEPTILDSGGDSVDEGTPELTATVGVELRVTNDGQTPVSPGVSAAFVDSEGRVYGSTGVTGGDGCGDLPDADLAQGQFAQAVECYEVSPDGGTLVFQETEGAVLGQGLSVVVPAVA